MALPTSRPAARLPGVYIETVQPPRADVLPRMDVAAFVGFASSGPLHLPVPVEDVSRFRDIFGPDLVLARDEARETDQGTLLGPAVEAFFANGGRRAFVVRVADPKEAVTLETSVTGLTDSLGNTATARARSPGLWAASYATDTRLRRRRLIPAPNTGLLATGEIFELRVASGTEAPQPGDLIEATFEEAGLLALILVDTVLSGTLRATAATTFWRARTGSPASNDALGVDDEGLLAMPAVDPAVVALLAGSPAPVPDSLNVLTFDLLLWDGERIKQRLDGLGFASAHPRYWADLPDDAALYSEVFGRPTHRLSAEQARFEAEAATPRFPLAGPESDTPSGIWLPQGMKTTTDRSRAVAPSLPPGTRLEAEGLADFSDRLFLDERFARLVTQSLGAEMEAHYADLAQNAETGLYGLHALAPIGEVAMIAIPDAMHRPWTRATHIETEPLEAPPLDSLPRTLDTFGRLHLSWKEVPGALRYRIEIAESEAFATEQVFFASNNESDLPLEPGCPLPIAARVRAERGGEAGPWSNTRRSLVPEETFESCSYTDPDRLSLVLTLDPSPIAPRLSWHFDPPGAAQTGDRFELQSGAAPGLEDATPVASLTDATEYFPDPLLDGARYFRVRVIRDGVFGPWSITRRLDPSSRGDWVLVSEESYRKAPLTSPAQPAGEAVLTAVHRALIRFAAARADTVALLSLPRHYREPEIEFHLARLSPLIDDISGEDEAPAGERLVPGLRFGEEHALSYAALQHPWFSTVHSTSLGFQPPDGAAAGLIASRANGVGVWIASANIPIGGTVALDPILDDEVLARLIARRVNPLRRDPRGFMFFNAETLAPGNELRPLPVRLLMLLLRRLALRDGASYVFEPHSADFRAQVRRRFERMLSLIHQRGGFAGSKPAQGFRVVTDESINPPSAVDRGQFTVELRVAPSRPFRYLNVRLLRTGQDRLSVREGQ